MVDVADVVDVVDVVVVSVVVNVVDVVDVVDVVSVVVLVVVVVVGAGSENELQRRWLSTAHLNEHHRLDRRSKRRVGHQRVEHNAPAHRVPQKPAAGPPGRSRRLGRHHRLEHRSVVVEALRPGPRRPRAGVAVAEEVEPAERGGRHPAGGPGPDDVNRFPTSDCTQQSAFHPHGHRGESMVPSMVHAA